MGNAQLLRLEQKSRPGRVIHHVHHTGAVRKLSQVHRRLPVAGIHTHRGGVHDELRVGLTVQIAVMVLAAAGDDQHLPGFPLPQHPAGHHRGAAASQDQGLLPLGVDAVSLKEPGKTVGVGIVAVDAAVRTAQKGVDAADLPGGVGERVAEEQHALLVGDGHVQALPFSFPQEVFQLLRLPLEEAVGIGAQLGVDLR